MKKLLIATLLFTALAASVPEAGACDKKSKKYSKQSVYYREDYRPSYQYYEERPVYYRPAPVVQYRSYDYDDYRPVCRTPRRSALSFAFGF